jgi:hypothetical protein
MTSMWSRSLACRTSSLGQMDVLRHLAFRFAHRSPWETRGRAFARRLRVSGDADHRLHPPLQRPRRVFVVWPAAVVEGARTASPGSRASWRAAPRRAGAIASCREDELGLALSRMRFSFMAVSFSLTVPPPGLGYLFRILDILDIYPIVKMRKPGYIPRMPRLEEFPVKFQLAITDEMDAAINDWRRRQRDLPNRSAAIRRLVEQALAADQGPKRRK